MFKCVVYLCCISLFSYADTEKYINQIDSVIEKEIISSKEKPGPLINDEQFVRRIFLDTTGRIPTSKEFREFFENQNEDRRSQLVEKLLYSKGYEFHNYNFLSNMLRINYFGGSLLYANWIKQEIHNNTPWDEFVRKLVTAEGNQSDNPAIGFYLRDKGMPLDHLSNTMQIFTGVRLQCAQCHDHPFDKWTQKQFFELASFTYPVSDKGGFKKYGKKIDFEALKNEGFNTANPQMNELRRNLDQGAFLSDKHLKYPHDYKYEDAKPSETVVPNLPFSDSSIPVDNRKRVFHFANWLTSPKNPLFTKSIVNRLWKRIMGEGVFEPVDDVKDDMKVSNPELLEILSKLMIDCKYDLRKFQSVIFRTKAYQRVNTFEKNGLFNGPVLRRLSAEQVWDSYCTLNVPDLDHRPNDIRVVIRLYYMHAKIKAKSAGLTGVSNEEYNRKIIEVARKYAVFMEAEKALYKKLIKEEDKDLKKKISQEISVLRREVSVDIDEIVTGVRTLDVRERLSTEYMKKTMTDLLKVDFIDLQGDTSKWKNYDSNFIRSSMTGFPAKGDHFMRVFGSSDFEIIDNYNNKPTITQSLQLLNGLNSFSSGRNFLIDKLKGLDIEESLKEIFISVLSREPSNYELSHCKNFLTLKENSFSTVIRALFNSKSFMFY